MPAFRWKVEWMKDSLEPLAPERLAWRCDPASLGFDFTDEIPPLEGLVGQDRALGAIELGLDLEAPGYNLYVAGPAGSGRTTTVQREAARLAARKPTPGDWCYINNFEVPYRPLAVLLPTGMGPEFARDLEGLVTSFRQEIPKLLESEGFQRRRAEIVRSASERHESAMADVSAFARKLGFGVQLTPGQVMVVPLHPSGEPMKSEEFEQLTPEVKTDLQERNHRVQDELDKSFLTHRHLDQEAQEHLEALSREFAELGVGHLFDALRMKYAGYLKLVEYLSTVQSDLVAHVDAFREAPRDGPEGAQEVVHRTVDGKYAVNALVSNAPAGGAPIVFEPNPTYYNLVGRIDYKPGPTSMATDLTLIKPGALHRANGGFLIMQARDLLLSPHAWEALKRALRDGEIRVENLGDQLSPLPTTTLQPEPIPLSVKVILIGDVQTYMTLYQMDEDFSTLFKVKAQFAAAMDRTDEAIRAIAGFVSGQVHSLGGPAFSREAVARVVEHASRLAEDQDRLATRFDGLGELVVEASHWARQESADRVGAEHVDKALASREQRVNLVEEELHRVIQQGTIAIDTDASVVGQVNGLSVLDLGDHTFGQPSRITASVGMGSEGVINIEREAHLSGPTHNKGVLILSGYLREQYASNAPLALSAGLAFEQSYGGVDGDSASTAELCALISAIADVPIRQSIAVTGSINQRGQIQAVGGVTHKIEGFFAVCEARGLTGEQGVTIPASNVRHLVLKREVVKAVAEGKFRIWGLRTLDEALELLTGIPAGARAEDGSYPEGTVHYRAQRRLNQMAATLAQFGGNSVPQRAAVADDLN